MNSFCNHILNRKNILYVFVFLILYMSSSFIMLNNVLGTSSLIIGWLILFSTIAFQKKKWCNDTLRPGIALLFVMLVSHIINGDDIVVTVLCISPLVLSIGCTFIYSYKEFSDAFIKVMIILCVISIICYIGALISDFFRGQLLQRPDGSFFYNFHYIHVTWFESIIPRNFGLFWEPGAFQAYISLALLLSLQKNNTRILDFVIFTIATITTFSTTGYIVYAIIFIFILPRTNLFKQNKKQIIICAAILSILLFTFSAFLLSGDNSTFGKLSGGKDGSQTAYVRYYSVIIPLKAFVSHPILGLGYSGLQNYSERDLQGQVTCTFINYFSMFGVFYGSLMIRGYYRLAKRLYNTSYMTYIVFCLFFLITFSENMIRMPIFIILPLLAYQRINKFRGYYVSNHA